MKFEDEEDVSLLSDSREQSWNERPTPTSSFWRFVLPLLLLLILASTAFVLTALSIADRIT